MKPLGTATAPSGGENPSLVCSSQAFIQNFLGSPTFLAQGARDAMSELPAVEQAKTAFVEVSTQSEEYEWNLRDGIYFPRLESDSMVDDDKDSFIVGDDEEIDVDDATEDRQRLEEDGYRVNSKGQILEDDEEDSYSSEEEEDHDEDYSTQAPDGTAVGNVVPLPVQGSESKGYSEQLQATEQQTAKKSNRTGVKDRKSVV